MGRKKTTLWSMILVLALAMVSALPGFAHPDVDFQANQTALFALYDVTGRLAIYAGVFDQDTARDFTTGERAGISAWTRFEDNELNFDAVEPADPFSGNVGGSARIADYGGQLVFARNWSSLEASLAGFCG